MRFMELDEALAILFYYDYHPGWLIGDEMKIFDDAKQTVFKRAEKIINRFKADDQAEMVGG